MKDFSQIAGDETSNGRDDWGNNMRLLDNGIFIKTLFHLAFTRFGGNDFTAIV